MIKTCALYSGSSGNSIFVSDNDSASVFYNHDSGGPQRKGTKLLVDAGVNGREIQDALISIGESANELSGILITHEHVDHMRGLGVIMRRYNLPLYVNRTTWKKLQELQIGRIPDGLVHFVDSESEFEIGTFGIRSFRTPHDAVESVGYKITFQDSSVSIITDIGVMTESVSRNISGSTLVYIESNYDYDMLWDGPYPIYLKKRIHGRNGHLSNADCAVEIGKLIESGTTRFVLSHLSKENNTPSHAREAARKVIEELGADIEKDVLLQIASRYNPSEPWTLS